MSTSQLEAKGLFAGLFDFSFTTFITLKFLRVIYIILLVLIALGALAFLAAGLSEGGGTAVATIIFVPLIALLYLVFARIYMELIALFFRIGESTSIMAAHLTGGTPPSGGSVGTPPGGGYGTPPSTPPSTPPGTPPASGYGYGTPPPA